LLVVAAWHDVELSNSATLAITTIISLLMADHYQMIMNSLVSSSTSSQQVANNSNVLDQLSVATNDEVSLWSRVHFNDDASPSSLGSPATTVSMAGHQRHHTFQPIQCNSNSYHYDEHHHCGYRDHFYHLLPLHMQQQLPWCICYEHHTVPSYDHRGGILILDKLSVELMCVILESLSIEDLLHLIATSSIMRTFICYHLIYTSSMDVLTRKWQHMMTHSIEMAPSLAQESISYRYGIIYPWHHPHHNKDDSSTHHACTINPSSSSSSVTVSRVMDHISRTLHHHIRLRGRDRDNISNIHRESFQFITLFDIATRVMHRYSRYYHMNSTISSMNNDPPTMAHNTMCGSNNTTTLSMVARGVAMDDVQYHGIDCDDTIIIMSPPHLNIAFAIVTSRRSSPIAHLHMTVEV
jgi:hypothetical protein